MFSCSDSQSNEREAVKVIVRCRPFSEKEKAAGHSCVVEINKDLATVAILDSKGQDPPKTFTFDSVFDWTSKQLDVYNTTARPIVESVLNGYNGTILAYGQTGTGKTFSMEGIRDVPELRGIIPNAFEHLFAQIRLSPPTTQYLVRASYLEIYNEDIRDLLNPKGSKLEIKERSDVGVYIKDLRTFVIKDVEEMDKLMSFGNKNRSVGATEMNATSSRSHSIFSITVEASERDPASGEDRIRAGKLHLVDLAGSERQSKTGATGERLKEATKINLSLSALGNVISALVDGKSSHIPYRDSKLTRLLQDSLGGNARTLMIATLSPASYNYDETVSTLRYANRAKNIKNKPKVNEDPKDAMLREFQEEIKRLKMQLESEATQTADGVRVVEEIEEVEEVEEVEETDSEDSGGESDGAPGDGRSSRSKSSKQPREKKGGKKKRKVMRRKSQSRSGPPPAGGGDSTRVFKGIPEDKLAEMAAEVEREKVKIMAAKDMEEDAKNRLLEEAQQRAAELEQERKARDGIAAKLAQLERKLLVGGVSLVDKELQIQNDIADRQAEIEEQNRAERELTRKLEEHEEVNLQIEEEYASLQEEAVAKTKKLKKLWGLIVAHRSEIKDLQEEHQREREDLLDTVRELTIELKLRMLMIHSFVPDGELAAIEGRADYDEAAEKWRIQHIAHAGNNIRGKRSLISGKVVVAPGAPNPGGNTNAANNMGALSGGGGHLPGAGFHREHEYDGLSDDDESGRWDPLCAFPDPYLTYDVPTDKKKKAPEVKASAATAAAGGVSSSGSARKARPASAMRRSPTKGTRAGGAGGAAEGDGAAPAAPAARGLVAKGRHYA
ncbi:Kinesin-like protein kif3b [Irineochytrium annulatum]|nr:Kinesin-like protein kif3b [Irineochytrium annulatum]